MSNITHLIDAATAGDPAAQLLPLFYDELRQHQPGEVECDLVAPEAQRERE